MWYKLNAVGEKICYTNKDLNMLIERKEDKEKKREGCFV